MKKWETFSKDDLQKIVKESFSVREVANKCGYSMTGGGSIKSIKEMISYYNFDTSHFLGQGWNKNNFDYSRFKNGQSIKVAGALKALTNLRGYKCEQCLNETWNGDKIPLEIHHKDGNNLNNELNNLQLLCPNCHAQTENWRGKNVQNKIKRIEISDEDFAEALKNNSSIRQALISLGLSPKGGNYKRAYEIAIRYNITKFIK